LNTRLLSAAQRQITSGRSKQPLQNLKVFQRQLLTRAPHYTRGIEIWKII